MKTTRKITREEQIKLLRNMKDEEIDYSDIPELDDNFWNNAAVGKPLEPRERISITMKKDVLEWFRNTGKGYQTTINAILESFVNHHSAINKQRKISSTNPHKKRAKKSLLEKR